MMTLFELRAKIGRLQKRLGENADPGIAISWGVRSDNDSSEYEVIGIRSPTEYLDDIQNLVIWLFNVKDYLKKRMCARNFREQAVEDFINASPEISLCADLANSLKHDGLDRNPRSGTCPTFGGVSVVVPQDGVQAFSYLPSSGFKVSVQRPDLVQYFVPILDQTNAQIGEAGMLCSKVIDQWESFIEEYGLCR